MQEPSTNSEMDVSFDEAGDHPLLSWQGSQSLGYYGWAAKRLLLSNHRIFATQQGSDKDDLVAESLKIRGEIYFSISNIIVDDQLRDESEEALEDENVNVFHYGLRDFYHVWTLAEGLLLDSAPLPAVPLLRWLNMYNHSDSEEATRPELYEAEQMAREAEGQGVMAELTPAYWKAVRSLVVGVMPRRAEKMLRSHPNGHNDAHEVGAIASQLKKMPLLLPEQLEDGGNGIVEAQLNYQDFFENWTRWQKSCKAVAASFGVIPGVGGGRIGEDGDLDERRQLRWLWGALCGVRSCLEEATNSWSRLFAAVLGFERPDVRKDEVAPLLRECGRKYRPPPPEEYLVTVIRDVTTGTVTSIMKFARERGETLALSSCAVHLVDLLFRAQLPSVTRLAHSWFIERFVDQLKTVPGGGWELAATYLAATDRGDTELLTNLAHAVVPGSERAAHELVEWCRVNGLGPEAEAMVCRARGVAWLRKTGFPASAWGGANEKEEDGGRSDDVSGGSVESARVNGACGKAAYWLARGGGGILLERLCAEVSERMMVEIWLGPGADVEAQRAVVAEAEGVLAAVPQDTEATKGPEFTFLEQYKDIACHLLAESEAQGDDTYVFPGLNARLAGFRAVDMLAPRERSEDSASSGSNGSSFHHNSPPPRVWAHLLYIALPVLESPPEEERFDLHDEQSIELCQVHILLSKMQMLSTSEHRVGTEAGDRAASTLSVSPAPYGFLGGKDDVLRVRAALARCLARTMKDHNREEASSVMSGGLRGRGASVASKRLSAEALILPRVASGM